MSNKVALLILDGWGIGDKSKADAVFNANTPYFDHYHKTGKTAQLLTDGEHVGLPEGQMGNSEVGHLNIGAGRVVYQDLAKINKAIKDGSFYTNTILLNAFLKAKANNGKIHLMGLVSDGGVHSHIEHLIALCKIAEQQNVEAFIHGFTDGRDTDPNSGKTYFNTLEKAIVNTSAKVATIIGRYYAMDRDNRWERIAKAYNLLVNGKGEKAASSKQVFENSYNNNITDEFIEPHILDNKGLIEENDVVICFNFRTDRCREISVALTQRSIEEENLKPLQLEYYTMTRYDKTFKNVNVVFNKENLENTLGEVVSKAGKTQVRIAETEKYPHVTFFFSGGREEEFTNEKRLLVHSPKVATYDLQPEMSAFGIANSICKEIDENQPDFICLNFANPDMVGHTGVYDAIIKAVETTDTCMNNVVEKAIEHNYKIIIIADHGNADKAFNKDGSANTAHTTNPVPVIVLGSDKDVSNGVLADIAPTVLELMNIPQVKEMTGKSILK